jgi:hypothetical protein
MRWSVIGLALLVSAPTLYSALWTQDVPVDSAVIHFLIALPIMAVLSGIVRAAGGPRPVRRSSRSANEPSVPVD